MRALAFLFSAAIVIAQSTAPFTSVSSASFTGDTFAPGAAVTGFGTNLSSTIAIAPAGSAPTSLGGVSVQIIDSHLQTSLAGLLYVSPGQINYVLPQGLPDGITSALVKAGSTTIASGVIHIASVSPALFAANNSGSGLAAARALIVPATGASIAQLVFDCTTAAPRCQPVPVVFGSSSTQVYLELYGTGIRGRSSLSAVQATAAGIPLQVLYAGAQAQYPGLDQVNVLVPFSVANAGLAEIVLTVDGKPSNPVLVQFGGSSASSPVSVQFAPASPGTGPFPTDYLTVPDATQKTGLRVNLPLPDCSVEKTTCETYTALNQLDGFNLQPRIAVQFTAPVNTNSLRNGIHLVWLDNLTSEEKGLQPAGHLTAINRVVYDPASNTVYAKPDEALDQHRRYALVITDAVQDSLGNPLSVSTDFTACVTAQANSYCRQLATALPTIQAASGAGKIIAASVFTTLSATAWLESARTAVQNTPPAIKRVAIVNLQQFISATLKLQTKTNPVTLSDFTVPLPSVIAAGSDRVVFGSYDSPNFLDAQQTIAAHPTATALPAPTAVNSIAFHAFVPESQKPAAGYPVIIFGHGLSDSSFGAPTLVAGTFARHGFVTLVINAVGHGSGPQTQLVLTNALGQTTTIPVPGRGVDLNNDGNIGSREGCLLTTGGIALRDCLRQTTVDLMQLAHAIRNGLDLDGDGAPDIDRSRVYFAGQSLGSLYGTMLTAVEPDVTASALNVGGGSVVDIAMFSDQFKPLARDILALHTPPLLNAGDNFNADPAFRDQPVKITTVPGAIAIQNYMELLDWLQASGDPLSFAPHLKRSPLPGVAEKRVLFQIARGDRTVPNPANSNLIRSAGGQDSTVLYRHDIAKANSTGLADNPHAFLVDIRSIPGFAVAQAAQGQIAGFLESGGINIPDANSTALNLLFLGNKVFERPAALPEDLGF